MIREVEQTRFVTSFLTSRKTITVYSTVVLFTVFAGQSLRNLLSWWGFSVITVLLFAGIILLYVNNRSFKNDVRRAPKPLIFFLLWCIGSILWSQYTSESALGVTIQLVTASAGFMLAFMLSWDEILFTLSNALKWILGLSISFEFLASFILRKAIFPFFPPENEAPWTSNMLLHGGPIQGIVGNRNLLGFIAILLAVTVVIQFFQTKTKPAQTLMWVLLCAAAHVLTDSATVTLAAFAVIILAFTVLLLRKLLPSTHKYAYYILTATLLAFIAVSVTYSTVLFSILGRDPTASGRYSIWSSVVQLSSQHPVEGWGWMGYWAPWVEPFKGLAVIDGVTYLQAHNALLDLWLQVGFVGVVLGLITAIVASVRAWRIAVAPVNRKMEAFSAMTVFPVMMIALLLIQSLTESRLLIEGNWLLFVFLCCKVKTAAPPYGSLRKRI